MIQQNSPKQDPMHPADIKAALQKANSSAAQIARELDISETAVAHVIYGRSSSLRIASKIAERTGIDIHLIWPDRYNDEAA